MKFEDLQRYTPSAVPGDKGRGLIVTLEPSEDGEAVLVKDLPPKRCAKTDPPELGSGKTVIMYFADGTHTFGMYMGSYWNVDCFGPVEDEVIAWREILV